MAVKASKIAGTGFSLPNCDLTFLAVKIREVLHVNIE